MSTGFDNDVRRGLERKVKILTLKLASERAQNVLDNSWGPPTRKATADQIQIEADLDALQLTDAEKAL